MALVVLFGMFAASAATLEFYKQNEDTPWFTDKTSINEEKWFNVYDMFAQAFAFDATKIKTTFYKDGSFKIEYTYKNDIISLKFDANEKDDIRSFADLCQAYTLLNIQQKLLK